MKRKGNIVASLIAAERERRQLVTTDALINRAFGGDTVDVVAVQKALAIADARLAGKVD